MSNCVPFCYWKGAKFAENEFSGSILCEFVFFACVVHTVPELKKIFCVLEGRAESALSFLVFIKSETKDSPPFPRKKIDSGGFCGITFGIFTHTEVWVVFFFLNNITRITCTIGTDRSMYKAERENTC